MAKTAIGMEIKPVRGGTDVPIKPSMIARIMAAASYVATGNGQWFGPGEPLAPVAPADTAGRQFNIPVAVNQNTSTKTDGITYQQLRQVSDQCDVIRTLIETRKDQMCGFGWAIQPIEAGEPGVDQKPDPRIAKLTAFFKSPDKQHKWSEWLRMLLEDLFVLDAPALYMQRTYGGELFALHPIDGATIKRIVDQHGWTPIGSSPAYQQILRGMPAIDYTTDELIYKPRNPRTHRIYGYCYDDKTEILTRHRGWVRFNGLRDTDMVATRSMAGAFEWQLPSRHVNEQWDGPMYAIHSSSVDLMVTPEHRMLVNSLPRALGGNKTRSGDVVITAQQFADHANRETKIPMVSTWAGEEVGEQVFEDVQAAQTIEVERVLADGSVQRFTRRKSPARTVRLSGDDFCALMGAYVAEGNIRAQGGIEVAQLEQSKGYGLYRTLFDRIGGGYNGRSFTLARRAITPFFRQFGHAQDKFVPAVIMDATPRQLRIFWDHYIAGDGHHEKRPNQSGRGQGHATSARATTVSRQLADQLVEIAQKLGMSASCRTRPAKRMSIMGQPESACRQSYVVSCRTSRAMNAKADLTHYTGSIHCVTVPNGIVYVRRNGKPAWCGNSPVEQVIVTAQLLLSRMASNLEFYQSGNLPEGFLQGGKDWTPEQIGQFQEHLDTLLGGNFAERRKARVVPEGSTYQAVKEPALKSEFDEWLARIACFAFSYPPSAFVKDMNRATSESAKEAATEEGVKPLRLWVKELIDSIVQDRFGFDDLEFTFEDSEAQDPMERAQIDAIYLAAMVLHPDEVRADLGKPPLTPEQKDDIAPPPPVLAPENGPQVAPPNASPPQITAGAAKPGDEKKKPVTKRAPRQLKPINRKSAAIIKATTHLAGALTAALSLAAEAAAKHLAPALGKAAGTSENSDDPNSSIIDDLSLPVLYEASDDLLSVLSDMAADGADKALTQLDIGGDTGSMFSLANEKAVAFANKRAAELITSDAGGGELLDGTRALIRGTVEAAVSEGWSPQKLAQALKDSYAFSPDRAETIARTEVSIAHVAGSMEGYRASGVVEKKVWLLADDPCDECQGNADDGEIPLDDDFSSGDDAAPAHPRCLCDTAPVVYDDATDSETDTED